MNCILQPFAGDLKNGSNTFCDLFDRQGRLLVAKGMMITDEIARMANKHEIFVIHVEWQDLYKPTRVGLTKLLLNGKEFNIYSPELYFHIVNWIQKFCKQVQLVSIEQVCYAVEVVDSLFKKIISDTKLCIYFNLFKSYDNYLTAHSINVALFAAIIANNLEFKQSDLEHVVMGAMLHDIGKLMIPKEILNKAGALNDAEYNLVKNHPEMGQEILNLVDVHPETIYSVIQHQERWDGGGYPRGLSKSEIHINAQIIALADVFDAVTTIRPYRLAYPIYHAVEIIVNAESKDFSPAVVKAFKQAITLYPENSLIKLNTGEIGKVVATTLNNLTRPEVEICFDSKGLYLADKKMINLSINTTKFVSALKCGGNSTMNIMLIDDDKNCILGLAGAIEPAGYHCDIFTVPEKAVKEYINMEYDVVITDMKMPGMNGIEVLQAIKSINPNAKVIINTGYGDVDTAIAAVNNGAYAFFGKPVNIGELLDILEKISVEVEHNKKVKEEQARLAIEYAKLKMAYHDLQGLIKEKVGEWKRGKEHE